MEIEDKVVVVTGAGSGIGEALARRFVDEGASRVVVTDLDGEAAKRVADEIGADARRLDVTDEPAVTRLVDEVVAAEGAIDLFVSNAGVLVLGGADAPDDDWRLSLEVNTMAHVYAARAVLPHMLERGEGYLLQTVSAAGLLTQLGSAPYTVSKAAALAFAEWLAVTHGDAGIRVSALCPQGVDTAMTAAASHLVDTVDGDDLLAPSTVADVVVEGLRDERFLILPHPEVAGYMTFKATDTDRWIRGMRKLQRRLDATS